MGIAALAALTLGKLAFAQTLVGPTLFLMHFMAVLVASWYGGLWAGLCVTALSAASGYFAGTHVGPAADDVALHVVVFSIEGVAVSWLAARSARERRRALGLAQSAREATDKLEVVLRGVTDGITMQDHTGKLVYANEAAARIVGFASARAFLSAPLAEVMQRFELLDASGAPLALERLPNRALFQGKTPESTLIQYRLQGTEQPHWSVVDANGVFGEDGKLRFVVNMFRDVTERQRQEEAERRAEEQREFLARATLELNSSLDYSATLATVARLAVPRMADWCAVDIVEPEGLKRLAVAHINPSKVQWVEALEQRYPPDPNAPNGVFNILRTGKAEIIAQIPAALLEAAARDAEHLALIRQLQLNSYIGVPLSRGGSTFGVITLVLAESRRAYQDSDLEVALALADRASIAVENARLYRAAEQARTDAVSANRAKDDFLAMLGHELRNPLAPIVTALDVMRRRPDASPDRERLVIERQVQHVVRLVDDLLDVSRITRGRVVLAREPVEVSDVVAKALELSSPLLLERRHQVSTTISPGLVILSDGTRLTQVLTNLLTNAAKYTDPGGRIELCAERVEESLVLRVKDDGTGIAPEMLSRIFELFVQAPQTIERARGGLGLGLTIVQSLVRSFGGSVTAHSPGPGQGSEFVVRIPFVGVASHPNATHTVVKELKSVNRLRMLVVDDNVDALEMLTEALGLLGHDAQAASDVEAALTLAARSAPRIALLDIGLPVIDGYELGRRLRAVPGLAGIKLVALTGYGQASDRERSRAAGFDAHLVKPVDLMAIQALLAELFPTG